MTDRWSSRARSQDDGFTVAELVIAAAILFFALTALIGLMGASTSMTASAKSKSILANTITSELDLIRALPIDRVALTNAFPAGDIPPTKTVVKDGFTITITFTVTDRIGQNNTKEVNVRAQAVRPGFPTVASTSFAAICDRVGGATRADNSSAPVIEFTDATPAPGTVVAGGPINIEARATSESFNIVKFEFSVDTPARALLKDGNSIYAGKSSWDVEPPSPSVTDGFAWNTLQVNSVGAAEIPDGRRIITIVAWDDQGLMSARRQREFLVDNYPPDAPSNPVAVLTTQPDLSQFVNFRWVDARDGTDPAASHDAEIRENTNGGSVLSSWANVGSLYHTATTVTVGPRMSCYGFRVQGVSPLGNAGAWATANNVLSRPVWNGSHDVARVKKNGSTDRWTYTSRFDIEPPRYPYTGLSVRLDRSGGAAASVSWDVTSQVTSKWSANQNYTFSDVLAQEINKNATPTPPEYRLVVTLTPAGFGGGTPTTLYSNYARGTVPAITNTSPPATNLAYAVRW